MMIQIPELYDCVRPPTWASEHQKLVFFMAVLAVGALVFLGYRAYTQYVASRKPYWQVALEELASINLPVTSSWADEKRFYDSLTRVLKWYCGNRYGWFLKSKTDKELVVALIEMGVSEELIATLEAYAGASIQVRFAQDSVSHEQAAADKRSIVSFIERSIPIHS